MSMWDYQFWLFWMIIGFLGGFALLILIFWLIERIKEKPRI